jgi:hypothetical protein
MRDRHHFEIFDYGNFTSNDSVEQGWFTYDHRPRYGTNYVGLRGMLSILSEAYSHDPFERRVASTYAFVNEILSIAAERGPRVVQIARSTFSTTPRGQPQVAIRSELTKSPLSADVVAETLERTTDTTRSEPGVRAGMRRTGRYRTVRMPVYDRFDPTVRRSLPVGYVLANGDTAAIRLLQMHGVVVDTVASQCAIDGLTEFVADSARLAARAFQGIREASVSGNWRQLSGPTEIRGATVVRTAQPLAVLVAYLLEPESDDGLVAWNVAGRVPEAVTPRSTLPLLPRRIERPIPSTCVVRPRSPNI